MTNHWRNSIRRFTAVLALWVSAIGVHVSFAQARAKVTVQISVPGDSPVEKKVGLRVRAVPTSSEANPVDWPLGDKYFNFTQHFYQYTFQALPPGEYAFVVCDGLDYLPEVQTRTVKSGVNSDPVSFFLKAPKARDLQDVTSPTLKRADGGLIERDRPVFLRDVATGCIVNSVAVKQAGIAEFKNVPKRKYGFEPEADDQEPAPVQP